MHVRCPLKKEGGEGGCTWALTSPSTSQRSFRGWGGVGQVSTSGSASQGNVGIGGVGTSGCASTARILAQNGPFGRVSSALLFAIAQCSRRHASARCMAPRPGFRQAQCFIVQTLQFSKCTPNPLLSPSTFWAFFRQIII